MVTLTMSSHILECIIHEHHILNAAVQRRADLTSGKYTPFVDRNTDL